MGRLKNDIAELVDNSNFRGLENSHIAQRLIEAGLAIFEAEGTVTDNHRFIPNMEGDGSYHLARFSAGERYTPSKIEHLTAALGGSELKPGWSYVVKIAGDGVGFTTYGTRDDPREALQHAADQFLAYRDAHAAKHTDEGTAKARTNEHMAAMCYRALGEQDVAMRIANSPDYMLGLFPVIDGEVGFRHAVSTLVENGYERGVAHDDMMTGLFHEAFDIGMAHGWSAETRVVLRRFGGAFEYHMVAPTTEIGQEVIVRPPNSPVQADSGVGGPDAVPETFAALARHSDEPLSRRELVAYLVNKAEVATRKGDSDSGNVLQALAGEIAQHMEELPINVESALRFFFDDVHARNEKAGWWTDLVTGKPLKRNVGELLMLVVTELWEAFDAYNAAANDDKLPQYPGFGVEIGDAIIRLADIAGAARAGRLVHDSDTRNPGAAMFHEVGAVAIRYEAIRKTPAAKGDPETGDPVESMDIARMTLDKLAFNAKRADHKPENRLKEGGKQT